jgi:uncharacterized caspase-like protein
MKRIAPPKGELYVLAVGVNRFDHISAADKSQVPDLEYAVNDASKLAELLKNSISDSEFNQVHVRLLADSAQDQPTRQNILEALRFSEQVEPNDTVLLFLASHELSDKTGNYYFLPQDGELPDVEAILSGRNLTGKAASLLSWTDFFDSMRKAAGRRIMIVNTCQAKDIFGEFDSRSLRKRARPLRYFRCFWPPRAMNPHRNTNRLNMGYLPMHCWKVCVGLPISIVI